MPNLISRRESLYLDVARILAALAVLLDHAIPLFDLPGVTDYGHQAVIVFFVLSGYVICNVAETRETAPRRFLVARFARLWSVLVPAMALTILCDATGRLFGSHLDSYNYSPIDHPFIRLVSALSFSSQSWVSIQPFSNYATWSLSLEFWYYMIFAAWFFVPPGRARTIAVVLAMLFCGQKGLLLLPVWLMGVALQRSTRLRELSDPLNAILCLSGLLFLWWLVTSGVYGTARLATEHLLGPWLTSQLSEARVFWFDWILGFALTMHLAGARAVIKWIPLELIGPPIRWCAGLSFATYLFHMPLLHLAGALLARDRGILGIGFTLAVIALLGPPVERSKHWWRGKMNKFVDGPVISLALQRVRSRGRALHSK